MCASALQLENDELRAQLADRDALLAERDAKIADCDARVEQLARDLRLLEKKFNELVSRRRRGDFLIPEGQGVLFPHEAPAEEPPPEHVGEAPDGETSEDPIKRRSKPKQPAKKVDTSALPREDRWHELQPEERFCPDTGLPLVPIGEKTFEEIEFEPSQLTLIVHHQVVYGLTPEDAEDRHTERLTAPLPPRALDGCAAGPMLLAWILVQKYAHHLPLYRQEQIFGRDGLRLPRQTMCDWVLAAAERLSPIVEALLEQIRAGPVMQFDDTPVICQGGKGKGNFQAYLWVLANPEVDAVVYRFTPGRASELIAPELGQFQGICVGDGLAVNKKAADLAKGSILLAGCWAHATRKFKDAKKEAPATAELFRQDIRELYAIEERADEDELSADERRELRVELARPVLARLYWRGRRLLDDYSDAGKMAEAIKYMLNQHVELRRFLDDGRVPIDNNRCERAIRPVAVGRRNWLFAGSVRGGEAAAIAYTVIESCRMVDVNMREYLADVLVRVGTQPRERMAELLPAAWAQERVQPEESARKPLPAR